VLHQCIRADTCFGCLVQALQSEGAWHEAERHYCEAKDWKGAVAMYRQQNAWEDALRVAKVLGGQEATKQVREMLVAPNMAFTQRDPSCACEWPGAGAPGHCMRVAQTKCTAVADGQMAPHKSRRVQRSCNTVQASGDEHCYVPAALRGLVCWIMQVAYDWATSLSGEDAAALLRRLNMAEGVVDYAVEINAFNHAFQLAQLAAKQKLPDVHLKYAMFLEDSGRFLEAEGEFVIAGRTRKRL